MRSPPAMRILVTGADGQLGRSLQALAQQRPGQAHYHFAARSALDITHKDAVAQWLDAHPADCLINAAAYTAVDLAAREPEQVWAVNAQAPGLLAQACARRGMRLLHVSTDHVFDGRLGRPYRETDTTAPLNAYGRSKLAGEQAVRQVSRDAVIVRTSWVFSAWGHNFVRAVLRRSMTQDALDVVDDQIGGPTWAGHLAGVLHALALLPAARLPGGLYHFSGAPWVSRHEFAREIVIRAHACGLLRRLPQIRPVASADWPASEPRPADSRLDCTRLEAVLGPLQNDWRLGLAACYRAMASW